MEDASKPSESSTTAPFIRRANMTTVPQPRPASAPLETADTTITVPLRRLKSSEEKGNTYEILKSVVFIYAYFDLIFIDQDKENDVRNAQATLATQAAIQRRRRPKRRSTGVVAFDNVDVRLLYCNKFHINFFPF